MLSINLLILILISLPSNSANEKFFEEVNPQFTLKAEVLQSSLYIQVLYNTEEGTEKSEVTLSDQEIKSNFSSVLSSERLFQLFKDPLNYAVKERGRRITVTFFITIPPEVIEQSFTINLNFLQLTPRKSTTGSIEKVEV